MREKLRSVICAALVVASLIAVSITPSFGSSTYGSSSGGGGGGLSANSGAASWPVANPRWYAVDGANGLDTNQCYSDVSSADAGSRACKTLAGLGKLFPLQGAGRIVVVRIAAGTYTDGLQAFLAGVYGYAGNFPLILPTVTNSTASSVAFAGDVNDKIMAGMVTASGMNAGGYNPVSPFSQSTLKLQLAGGGSPNFPSETGAPIPMGLRFRFDVNTTTAALRNVAININGIPAVDTLSLPGVTGTTGLPIAPVGSDVGYIEMPGVTVGATVLQAYNNSGTQATRMFGVPQFVAINFSTSVNFRNASFRVPACVGTFTTNAGLSTPITFSDEVNALVQVGAGLRNIGLFANNFSLGTGPNYNDGNATFVTTGELSLSNANAFQISNGGYIGAGVFFQNVHGDVTHDPKNAQPTDQLGARSVNSQSPTRVVGAAATPVGTSAGVAIIGSDTTLNRLDIEQAGAHPALQLIGLCNVGVSQYLTGSSGNSDVCLDLTASYGSTVIFLTTPTCTGTNGDIRLGDGTITSWASLATTPIKDVHGNRFITAGGAP